MTLPTLEDLPPPPEGRRGWPWTEAPEPVDSPGAPTVCIVIPSFNQASWLEQSLRSVILQGYPGLECHVMDGGSDDGSAEIIERYRNWFDHVQSQPDDGQCAVINEVLLKSKAELGGWMNADDFYAPGGIARLVRLRRDEPDHVLWCGAAREIDVDDREVRIYQPRVGTTEELAHWYTEFGFHQPSALFDLGLFKELGGLDEDLKCSLDVELWLRMRRRGRFAAIDEIISTVRNNPFSKTFTMLDLQAVEMIAIYHRMGLDEAARWRLDQFADRVKCDTLNHLPERADEDQVLSQYRYGELLRNLGQRMRSRFGRRRDP